MSEPPQSSWSSQLILRLILGVTMTWAGMGKMGDGHFTAEQAAVLADLGVVKSEGTLNLQASAEASDLMGKPIVDAGATDSSAAVFHTAAPSADGAVTLSNLHWVTLIVRAAAKPDAELGTFFPNRHGVSHIGLARDGDGARKAFLPSFLGEGRWPSLMAHFAAYVQLIGGIAVVLGVGMRVSSVLIISVMAGACWLTQFGPYAVGGAPGGVLGFLPPHEDLHPHAWKTWLWQVSLIGVAGSLVITGPGKVSVDRIVQLMRNRTFSYDAPTPEDA